MWGDGKRVVRRGSSSEAMADTKVTVIAVTLLQVLTNSVMDTTTPYDRLHGRSEVVVYESDVRSLLDNPGASNTHGEPDVGGLEIGVVVCTITGETGDLTKVVEGFDENIFILQGGPGQDLKVGTTSMCSW